MARIGAAISVSGAGSLAVYAGQVWRTRARWTGDRGWHVFAMGGLVSAIAWFELSVVTAAGRVLLNGTDPANAGNDLLVAPFVAGWMGLAVLASATHLVPSVGPGGPHMHGEQRRLLGRAGLARLIVADIGIALLVIGYPGGVDALNATGLTLVGIAVLSTTALIGVAVVRGAADARERGTLRA